MDLLSVIRRWRFRDKLPIREIERRTGLSRNTIRKYLRSGVVEPKFQIPDRPSKLDPFAKNLTGWLRIEASKSRKQRGTVKQMHVDPLKLGFDGPTAGLRRSPAGGRRSCSMSSRPADVELSCHWCMRRA